MVLDCFALETLATESCRADTDVECLPPVVVILQGLYCQQPAPWLIDRGTISR